MDIKKRGKVQGTLEVRKRKRTEKMSRTSKDKGKSGD